MAPKRCARCHEPLEPVVVVGVLQGGTVFLLPQAEKLWRPRGRCGRDACPFLRAEVSPTVKGEA